MQELIHEHPHGTNAHAGCLIRHAGVRALSDLPLISHQAQQHMAKVWRARICGRRGSLCFPTMVSEGATTRSDPNACALPLLFFPTSSHSSASSFLPPCRRKPTSPSHLRAPQEGHIMGGLLCHFRNQLHGRRAAGEHMPPASPAHTQNKTPLIPISFSLQTKSSTTPNPALVRPHLHPYLRPGRGVCGRGGERPACADAHLH
jgi:hypothetical protein